MTRRGDRLEATAEEVVRGLGVAYNTLLLWVRLGIVQASVQDERKQWVPVLFAVEDLPGIALMVRLRRYGVGQATARRLIREARARHWRGHLDLSPAKPRIVEVPKGADTETMLIHLEPFAAKARAALCGPFAPVKMKRIAGARERSGDPDPHFAPVGGTRHAG